DLLNQPDLRLAACTYSPEQVQRHYPAFEALVKELGCDRLPGVQGRLAVIRDCVLAGGHGVVEVLDLVADVGDVPPTNPRTRARPARAVPEASLSHPDE